MIGDWMYPELIASMSSIQIEWEPDLEYLLNRASNKNAIVEL